LILSCEKNSASSAADSCARTPPVTGS